MADAERRERVIRGLECCIDPEVPCRECPYYNYGHCDPDDVRRDALVMLKEQEPRVLTVEEIWSGAVEVAWIEDADKAEVIPGIWFRLSNEGEDEAVDIHIRDGFVGARLAVYGKLWRCWTSRPTPDQMANTPWEGDVDET